MERVLVIGDAFADEQVALQGRLVAALRAAAGRGTLTQAAIRLARTVDVGVAQHAVRIWTERKSLERVWSAGVGRRRELTRQASLLVRLMRDGCPQPGTCSTLR